MRVDRRHGLGLGICLLVVACRVEQPPPIDPAVHAAEIAAWREGRIEKLRQPGGWLSLVGLFWMQQGRTYTFGADSTNEFVYAGVDESMPSRVGTFAVRTDGVWFTAEPGTHVRAGDEVVGTVLATPEAGDAPLFVSGSIEWLVIERAGEYALRVRDTQSPIRTEFRDDDLPTFDVAPEWRLAGSFEWKDPADTINVPNILGGVNATPSPASVRFTVGGRSYRLALWKDSDDPANFFTAFGDATNGGDTYGGGRFLWIDAPDEEDRTIVDFNRSYNPPCVFTAFATCPLPPPQNQLPFAIPAGERNYMKH